MDKCNGHGILGKHILLYHIPPDLLRCCLNLASKGDTDIHLEIDTNGPLRSLIYCLCYRCHTSQTLLSLCVFGVTQVIQDNKHTFLFLSVSGRVFHLTTVYSFVCPAHRHAQHLLLVPQVQEGPTAIATFLRTLKSIPASQ